MPSLAADVVTVVVVVVMIIKVVAVKYNNNIKCDDNDNADKPCEEKKPTSAFWDEVNNGNLFT